MNTRSAIICSLGILLFPTFLFWLLLVSLLKTNKQTKNNLIVSIVNEIFTIPNFPHRCVRDPRSRSGQHAFMHFAAWGPCLLSPLHSLKPPSPPGSEWHDATSYASRTVRDLSTFTEGLPRVGLWTPAPAPRQAHSSACSTLSRFAQGSWAENADCCMAASPPAGTWHWLGYSGTDVGERALAATPNTRGCTLSYGRQRQGPWEHVNRTKYGSWQRRPAKLFAPKSYFTVLRYVLYIRIFQLEIHSRKKYYYIFAHIKKNGNLPSPQRSSRSLANISLRLNALITNNFQHVTAPLKVHRTL